MLAAAWAMETQVFTRLPDEFRVHDIKSAWTCARGSGPLHLFLEGPVFDRKPNGLKSHRDGRIFVADGHHGIPSFDSNTDVAS